MSKIEHIKVVDIKTKNNKLLFYNITFFYHNEQIELFNHYLKNIQTMIDNIKSNVNNIIIFNFLFFVSNLEEFINKISGIKEVIIKKEIYTENIIETEEEQIELRKIDIMIDNIPFQIININTFPNRKINDFIIENRELNSLNINCGINSIGYKRYCANILSWNIQKYLEKTYNKIYHDIRTFLFQIDFGTFVGMPIILHKEIKKMLYKEEREEVDLFNVEDNPLYEISNYWFCSKNFLAIEKTNICNNYIINESEEIQENIYSNYDFYYFMISHISSVINNYNIINYTCLGIHDYDKNKVIYKDKEYKYSGFPNINQKITQFKPKNKKEKEIKYNKLTKGHYDKFYIVDISLTYIKNKKSKSHITYNKNYTSFNEDISYSKMLLKLTNLMVPHPFLAISKCSLKVKDKEKIKNNNQLHESIYMLLPKDDLNNLKCYELNKWTNVSDPGVLFEKQEEEIDEFNKMNGGGEEYECNISKKTDTRIYSEKLDKVKKLYNELKSQNILNSFNYRIIDKLIIFYDNNIKIFSDLLKKKSEYNDKYNFDSSDFTDNNNFLILKKDNMYDYTNNITEFIKDYLNNSNCNKYIGGKYYKKYIKYKTKYILMKKIEKNIYL